MIAKKYTLYGVFMIILKLHKTIRQLRIEPNKILKLRSEKTYL